MELVYVLIGGVMAILGGAVTTFFSHRFGRRESQRQDLIAAYIEWSARLAEGVEEWKQLEFFDHVAQLKDVNQELQHIPTSPAGRTREEIVRAKLAAISRLESSCSRLILAETIAEYAERVVQISDFASDREVRNKPVGIIKYAEEKIGESHDLMRSLRIHHPLLRTS